MVGNQVLFLAWILAAEPEPDPTLKPLVKQFKVVSIDTKLRLLRVKELNFEVFWHAKKTQFYHHRSIALKNLAKGTLLHVFGKVHDRKSSTVTYSETDPLVSDLEYIGTGGAYREPPLVSRIGQVAWFDGTLARNELPYNLKIDDTEYRLSADDKTAAYSTELTTPEKLPGVTVVVRGNSRVVTVDQNGKPKKLTRLYALEVHVVELTPEHTKVFQLQWTPKKPPQEKQ